MEMIDIEVIDKYSEFQKLEGCWDLLLERVQPAPSVFLTYEWLNVWWKGFGSDSCLYVILAKYRGAVVGIAPFMIRKFWNRGLPLRQLSFIENGNSLHNDLIVCEENREVVLTAFLDHLFAVGCRWDMIELKNIPEDSRNVKSLRYILLKKQVMFEEKQGADSPYLKIVSDWDSYYRGMSLKSRKTLRNIQNRFKRHGNYNVRMVESLSEYESVKPDLYDIARNSWTEDIGDSLNTEGNKVFFDELSRSAAEKGWLLIWLLELENEPIAFEYHLKYMGNVHGLRSSYKKTHGNISPGVFLDLHIQKCYFESGDVREYDMGGSTDFYKRKWTSDIRHHVNFNIFHDSVYSRLLYFYEYKLISKIKHVIRKSG